LTDQGTEENVDVEARRAIEAVVLAATDPVDPAVLAQLIEVPTAHVEALCDELAAEYERDGRGFTIARVAGGYRFQTHPDAAPYVERFVLDGQHARLSGPALETLAIIAYKQPISRAQLSAIRGVNVDATLRTLVARGYVEEIGHDHAPGNPSLFATTTIFLERLGLDSLDQLPSLGDFVPDSSIVETLERGLRMPGEPQLAADADDVDDVAAADDNTERDESPDVLSNIAVEKFAVGDVTEVAAELQEGLDD
jgi:segregation and condensation protein B